MSQLKPFYIKSLEQMRETLTGLNKAELTWNGLEQLLPKYRDGLVGSGAYNEISRLLSANQYITDQDHLDALRSEVVERVDTAILVLRDKPNDPKPIEEVASAQKFEPPSPPPALFRSEIRGFPRRVFEAFLAKDALAQATILLTVIGSIAGGTLWLARNLDSWLIPALQFVRLIEQPAVDRKAEATIFLDCSVGISPRVFPSNGRIYFTNIFPSLIDDGVSLAIGYKFGTPGAAALPDDVTERAYECRLTNYGSSPVFNVTIPVHVKFREVLRPPNQPNSWQSGPIKAEKSTSISIPKIDAGKDSAFVLYLSSQSPDFVDLQFLDPIKVHEGNDRQARSARLVTTDTSLIRLAPYAASLKNSP